MSEPTIEQLEKNFREMDIPNLGDDELRSTAHQLEGFFHVWEKGNHSPDVEELIRCAFANVEAGYAAALYQPAYSFEKECGMGMQEPDPRYISTDTGD